MRLLLPLGLLAAWVADGEARAEAPAAIGLPELGTSHILGAELTADGRTVVLAGSFPVRTWAHAEDDAAPDVIAYSDFRGLQVADDGTVLARVRRTHQACVALLAPAPRWVACDRPRPEPGRYQ